MRSLHGSKALLALGAVVGIAGVAKGSLAISSNIPSTPYSNVVGSSDATTTFNNDQTAYQTPVSNAWYGANYTPTTFQMIPNSSMYNNVLEMEISAPISSGGNTFIGTGTANNLQGMNYSIPEPSNVPPQTASVGVYIGGWANFSMPAVMVGLTGNVGPASDYIDQPDAGIFYLANLQSNQNYLSTGYSNPGFYTYDPNDSSWLLLGLANQDEFNTIGFTTSGGNGGTVQYSINGVAVGGTQYLSTYLTSVGLNAYYFGQNSNNGPFYFQLSPGLGLPPSSLPAPSSAAGLLEGIGGLAIVGLVSLKKKRRMAVA